MPNPRWTVTNTRTDIIPGRITVEYTLDDGSAWATHFPESTNPEEVEPALDNSWLEKSNSQEAKDERVRKGKGPKLRPEHIPKGLVNKEARGENNGNSK